MKRKPITVAFRAFCLSLLFVMSAFAAAQAAKPMKLTGRVVDPDGFSLVGVTITIKGTTKGVTTDSEGKYELDVNAEDIVVYSYIGYKTQEILAKEADRFAVVLQPESQEIENVVVVAFGTQKKESVVASVSTVDPGKLRIPASNLTSAFAGQLAGVIAYQRSGEPGLDDAEFFIRGVTSFGAGKKDPLILIDGIEMSSSDLARLNVDDIGSFSVMKDASAAALYGARGANGVILVTTKRGVEESVRLSVRAEISTSMNTSLVELADPVTYMKLHNEAVRTRWGAEKMMPYSTAKILNTQLKKNPVLYPSVDWYDYMMKDFTINQRYSMNITGGGKAVQYYLSANFLRDQGILKEDSRNNFDNNIKLNRFQLRSNVDIKLTRRTKAVIRFYGTFDERTGPKKEGSEMFSAARNATSVMFLPFYEPDEEHSHTTHTLFGNQTQDGKLVYTNPYAEMVSGFKKSSSSMMTSQVELTHTFENALEGLVLSGIFNLKRDSYYDLQRGFVPFYYAPVAGLSNDEYRLQSLNPDDGTEYLDFNGGNKYVTSTLYGELRANYTKTIAEKHNITAMLVGTIRNASTTEVWSLYESLPNRNISLSGRLAYGYDSRYFIEGNFGYNGSERFAKSHRFGFFPSIGLGWMISNEKFMQPVKKVLTKLKLKATYGLVGNDQIGNLKDRFFYLSNINMKAGEYTFGTDLTYSRPGIAINRYADPDITWEIARKADFGVELGLWNALDIQADYFFDKRKNILQTRADIPSTMGLGYTPTSNVGEAHSEGFEISMNFNKSFNPDFWLTAMFNYTYAIGKYTKYEEADFSDTPWRSHVGQKINQIYGYIAERLFIDDEDVKNSPVQTVSSGSGIQYGAGDIKYKDINNDQVIDSNDMVPIGFPTAPEVVYGVGFSLGYKSIDFSCFFQGSGRSSFMISPTQTAPFLNNGQRALLKYYADDHWSEDNRKLDALWPRLADDVVPNNTVNSTWWLRNGSFLRLKKLEVGYTLPVKWTRKVKMDKARIYFNATNLFVLSDFKMWDPEMAGNGLGYPLQRVFNLGLNLNF